MRKLFSLFVVLMTATLTWALEGGTLTASKTPINPSETVTISYDGTGTNFANWEPKCFVHAWLLDANDQLLGSYTTAWASCNGDADYAALPSKVKMTFVSKGKYTIDMNIKSFFDVADADLAKIVKLGIIVRAQYEGNDNKTKDLFLAVEAPSSGEDPEEPEVPTPAEKDSVFFVNASNWEAPTAHLWGGTAAGTTWPGIALAVKIADKANGFDIYKLVTDKGAYANCIFSNNGANQTADLDWTSGKYFYIDAWYASIADIPAPEEPEEPEPVCQDGPYGFIVNGTDTLTAVLFNELDPVGRKQYKLDSVELKKDDKFVIANLSCGAKWVMAIEDAGASANFSKSDSDYVVLADGLYAFYIKMSYELGDVMYVSEIKEEEPEQPIVTKDIILVPRIWSVDDAKFAAWAWETGKAGAWSAFFAGEGDTLKSAINEKADSILFVRFHASATAPAWDDMVMNQTADLLIGESGIFTITGWGEGEGAKSVGQWTPYEEEEPEEPEPVCQDGPYGFIVNGTDTLTAVLFNELDPVGRKQYKLDSVELKKDDKFVIANLSCNGKWVMAIEEGGASANFTKGENDYKVLADGLYAFYIKMSMEQGDIMYIAELKEEEPEEPQVDPREKRDIVLVARDLKAADPSMFVMAFGSGKVAYDTIMEVKKVGDDTLYVARIPEELDSLIFVRAANGVAEWKDIIWDGDDRNVWNQTDNLKIECDTATFDQWLEDSKFSVTWCAAPEEPEEPEVPAVDTREKRDIVLVAGDLKAADPSMFVMAFGSGKVAYDTIMEVKKVGDDTLYIARIPEELDSLIFVRAANGVAEWKDIIWDGDGRNVWNQTDNLKIECDTATFDQWLEDAKFSVTWCATEPEEPEEIETSWYIAGSFTDWATGMIKLNTTDRADSLVATVNIEDLEGLEFKLVRILTKNEAPVDTMWFGLDEPASMTYDHSQGWWLFPSVGEFNQANVGIEGTLAGNYTFTVNPLHENEEHVLAPIVSLSMPAPLAQYGLLIEDETFVSAYKNPENEGEIMALGVSLTAGQKFQIYDRTYEIGWVITTFNEGSYGMSIDGDYYIALETGVYDFYIHLALEDDYIYISKQQATGNENVVGETELRKVIENGAMYIYRNGQKYSVQGYIVR